MLLILYMQSTSQRGWEETPENIMKSKLIHNGDEKTYANAVIRMFLELET